LNKYKFFTSRSSGFTLIELLVVVAILGILAAIGLVAYNGYISASKKTSTENIMQQISLAQTERYSDYSSYYTQAAGCSPSDATSRLVEKELLEGDGKKANIITKEIGFNICIEPDGSAFNVIASDGQTPECKITLNGNNQAITRIGC
tara:strand:- start:559 stop:1002 length:444 start_codon:yes stop_codon:yes gene_type:complete